jgi:hypothetical protein
MSFANFNHPTFCENFFNPLENYSILYNKHLFNVELGAAISTIANQNKPVQVTWAGCNCEAKDWFKFSITFEDEPTLTVYLYTGNENVGTEGEQGNINDLIAEASD